MIKKLFLYSTVFLALGSVAAFGNYTLSTGSTTFGSVLVGGTNYIQMMLCDLAAPSQCAAVSSTGMLSVNVVNSNPNGQALATGSSPVVLPASQITTDPCSLGTKTNFSISTITGTTQLVAPLGSTQVYLCSLFTIGAVSSIQNIVGGTGALCTTGSPVAIAGSTTPANGMSFTANGGFTFGNGSGTILRTTTPGHGICLIQNATARISGGGTFVQQ